MNYIAIINVALCSAVGKLPASQASAEVVSAHRMREWELTNKVLDSLLSICSRAKVIFLYLHLKVFKPNVI